MLSEHRPSFHDQPQDRDSFEQSRQSSVDPYVAKEKLFGKKAARISAQDYEEVVEEVIEGVSGYFAELRPAFQLKDKPSFGDIDIIVLTDGQSFAEYLKKAFGSRILELKRNGPVFSILLRISNGKTIHVDFIKAKDHDDFERKHIYYSMGHLSAMIGMLAKPLSFKYGSEGFFKRYQDARGNWHDIFITGNLKEGMRILGLDHNQYDRLAIIDDIVEFISSSPLFCSRYYESNHMVSRDRLRAKRISVQQYLVGQLALIGRQSAISDGDEFFNQLFPQAYMRYIEEVEKIEQRVKIQQAIDGRVVMAQFGLNPGPLVGKVMGYIRINYPDATELTPEMISDIQRIISELT